MNPTNPTNIRTCKICVLPETFPGIKLDEQGVCQFCTSYKGIQAINRKRVEHRQRFEELLKSLRERGTDGYDVLVAYSGGKDSTFTLDLLKNHYKLHILAITFDHGFVSPYAIANIQRVVETLGVDHIMFKPDFHLIKKVFQYSISNEFHPPKALERASSICNSCMGLVKFVTLRLAVEKKIPLIAYGWSPGQAPIQSAILKNHPSFIAKAQQLFLSPLAPIAGPDIKSYFMPDNVLSDSAAMEFVYNINILAFLQYDEAQIYARIRELGWESPKDTDPNSTNCLLNALANQLHLEKHGFHPYAMELAELVREGVLSREEAIKRLSKPSDPNVVEEIRIRLGLTG
jgi:tRNA(Ile)-lysidine synthase TilS/MesJ